MIKIIFNIHLLISFITFIFLVITSCVISEDLKNKYGSRVVKQYGSRKTKVMTLYEWCKILIFSFMPIVNIGIIFVCALAKDDVTKEMYDKIEAFTSTGE